MVVRHIGSNSTAALMNRFWLNGHLISGQDFLHLPSNFFPFYQVQCAGDIYRTTSMKKKYEKLSANNEVKSLT